MCVKKYVQLVANLFIDDPGKLNLPDLTNRELYGDAVNVRTEIEAADYLRALINWRMKKHGQDYDTARRIEKSNVAFYLYYQATHGGDDEITAEAVGFFHIETEYQNVKESLENG